MRSISVRLIPVALGAALCGGCAGGASGAAQAPSVVPLSAALVPPGNNGTVRRTKSVGPYCQGAGTDSVNESPTNGNVADGPDSVVVGGIANQACDDFSAVVSGYDDIVGNGSDAAKWSFIGGGEYNHVASGEFGVIAGGYQNTLDTSSQNAGFIGGGENNTVSGVTGVIAGGYTNTVSAGAGFVGGGDYNLATSNAFAAIVGGEYNTASGEGSYVGDGGYNTASGEGAVVDGGFNSTASGNFATVPGGYGDTAAGTYSFAAGARASAAQAGTFVWSDGSDGSTILTSSAPYQFLARASGGFTLYTNAAGTAGAQLGAGSGTWASLSDRNLKTNISPLDDASVLQKVASLPISRWSYKSEHGVRHVGPMAQDFYAAFKVGEDDRHITSIDEDGVALAAIKALHAENARLRRTTSAQTAGLRAEVASLRAEVTALRALVAKRAVR